LKVRDSVKFVSVVLAIALSTPLHAQDYGASYISVASGMISTHSVNRSLQIAMQRRAAKSSGVKQGQSPAPAAVRSLAFTWSPARSKENQTKFVREIRQRDPAGAANLARLFATTDVVGQIGAGIRGYGLRTNNMADAYTVYWINAWESSHAIVGNTETAARAQAVKRQAETALLSMPEVASATDAQKQEFAEAMLVQAAIINAYMELAADNPAQLAAVAKAVRQGAKASGLDLDTMVLTEQGFRPIRVSSLEEDRVPAPEGAGATALAAVDLAPPPARATRAAASPYLLMAAAVGAAIDGVVLHANPLGTKH
jgi:hypothetical protein